MQQAEQHSAASETSGEEPPHSNLTPAARALLAQELGEDWLRKHSFFADEVTKEEAEEILPWLRQVTAA